MATTTNYSWTTPDDTDLVKDGAAAIRTLGSSADTTVKDLNPGTTAGDIDYYTSSTAKARIAIGTAGQVLQVNAGATAPEWGAAAGAAFVGVKLFLPADQTIAHATATAVAFGAGSESIDTDAFHDESTNNTRITIPAGKAGKYLVIGAVNWVGNASGNRDMWVQKGASGRVMQADTNVAGSSGLTQTGIVIVSLAEADYIQLFVEQNTGGNLNVNGDFIQQTRSEAYFIGA